MFAEVSLRFLCLPAPHTEFPSFNSNLSLRAWFFPEPLTRSGGAR